MKIFTSNWDSFVLHLSVTSSSADSAVPSHQPLEGGELWSTLLPDDIPQLDGSTDRPKTGRRRVRKTLGVKRRRGQPSLHTHRPPDSSTQDSLSEGDTVPPGSAVAGHESSDSDGAIATAPEKARPSLSLKKKLSNDSAAVRSSVHLAMKEPPNHLMSLSLNSHPLVNILKQQALTDSFRPHVERLVLSQVTTECLRKTKKAPLSSSSETLKRGKQLRKRRRKDSKGDGRPHGWSKQLRSRAVGGGEGEELLLNLEWTTELEKYSYVEQLQAVIEESLKSPDGLATETTTDNTTAGDSSRPLAGGEVSSSAAGEECYSSHEMDSQPGPTAFVLVEASQDKMDVGSMSEHPVLFDVEDCTASPEELEVTVVAESPTSSPGVELTSEPGSPKSGPSQKTPPVMRGASAVPHGAASSSPSSGGIEPIPVPEELFDTVPLVDRVVCGVEGEVGVHDVSLADSDFHLALTASETESEDSRRVDVEEEDVLEGLPDSGHWHSEVELTSAEKTTGMYIIM